MRKVCIYKAQSITRDKPVESICIEIDAEFPERPSLSDLVVAGAIYDKEATALAEALLKSLPQAVSERLLIRLLEARQCYFVIPAEQEQAQPKRVVCAIIRRGDEILMARRFPNSDYPLMWEFPGGKVEPDDHSFEYALRREIREELGFDISVINERHQRLFMTKQHGIVDLHYFNCEVLSGEPSAIQCLEFKWFRAEELAFKPAEKMPVDSDLAYTIAIEAMNLINANKIAKGGV